MRIHWTFWSSSSLYERDPIVGSPSSGWGQTLTSFIHCLVCVTNVVDIEERSNFNFEAMNKGYVKEYTGFLKLNNTIMAM